MTYSSQTELDATRLWTNPPSWRSRMEQDAFELAFPDEERTEGDKVTLYMDYSPETEGYAYSEWTFDEGDESNFVIEVRWEVPKVSRFNPLNKRSGTEFFQKQTFFKKEALQFWLDLMRKGAE